MPPCREPALVAGGRSLLRDAFSPLTTYEAADLRRSKLHTLVELQPTASSASCQSRTGFSLSCPVMPEPMPPCREPALVAGGRSLLRDAFSPLTTYEAADLRRSKLHTLVELQPTASSASCQSRTGFSLSCPVMPEPVPPCREPALVAGGRSLLRDAFSPLTTYGAADLRRSKLHTLVELQPTGSSASGAASGRRWATWTFGLHRLRPCGLNQKADGVRGSRSAFSLRPVPRPRVFCPRVFRPPRPP
jgi:hypothetical protein